jgi:hypothetical protein
MQSTLDDFLLTTDEAMCSDINAKFRERRSESATELENIALMLSIIVSALKITHAQSSLQHQASQDQQRAGVPEAKKVSITITSYLNSPQASSA